MAKKKIPLSSYPYGVERDYLRDILELFHTWFDDFMKDLSIDGIKHDALPEHDVFNSVRHKWDQATKVFEAKIKKAGKRTDDYNFKIWQTQVKASLAVDIFKKDKWLSEEIEAFTAENVRLIKSLGNEAADKIQTLVTDAVKSGQSAKSLTPKIVEVLGVSERRAALISIDQIGKFNGRVSQLRQTNYGVTKYIWQTVGDERVRSSHRLLNGKTFDWDKEVPGEGFPGQPIRCRCQALPDFDSIID